MEAVATSGNLNSKKAAFVASVYRHFELFHLPFLTGLQDRGYEVHVYASADYAKERLEARGLICHDVQFERSPFQPKNVAALRALIRSFREEQFTLVHVHTPVASILGRIAARVCGVPSVLYTAHGFHFFTGAPKANWLLFAPVEWLMARQTDVLITINQEDYARAQKFPVRGEVRYVPGVGLDTQVFQPPDQAAVRARLRGELGLHEEEMVILCVAELNANKNQSQLFEAVKRAAARGIAVRCLLVGVGELEATYKQQVEEMGLSQIVTFLGYRLDIPDLMLAADVSTLLSKREGLPRSVMEAMAAGLPLVVTDVRGNRDLVQDGENGYLVATGDVEATADAFYQLYQDQKMRAEMGTRSKEKAAPYDLSFISAEMMRIYELAASGRFIG
ncbi:glycosyltransferase family 4 protein [Tumebacillus algifaecis]|uniref:glycosyltransferase family 4 protein n=1 Tax=Tumebacillus algifaecis TaxID=1214604 RepID=UPI0012FDB1D4|nr:glycosyltransferase family 4 protein [Tumebacillus algifaecis]